MNQTNQIAIVGLSCRFPGAFNKQMFWDNLVNGVDSVIETPSHKWNHNALFSDNLEKKGSIHSKYGGFLDEVHLSQFDNEFFSTTSREASVMDPQHKMLLELTMEAIQDSGMVIDSTLSRNWGVFTGIGQVDFNIAQMPNLEGIDTYTQTGMAHSIASNRLSNFFNLTGPSMSVDTACSSSLVALHLAVNSMNLNECECAIVAGVNLMLHPSTTVAFSKLGVLSMDGKCHTFDASASGYVRGEGAGVVILKNLQCAIRDGDSIYGVIKGTATNEDGGNKPSLTTPSEQAQYSNLVQTYKKALVDPKRVIYVEAHGTGTQKGDQVEANSIGKFFREGRDSLLNVGSVKSNIGHLECASGMAGLIKVLLMIKNRTLAPNIHFNTPNPNIEFEELKLRVITKAEPIEQEEPILMGVNSFGFGGSNAHVIVEEFKQEDLKLNSGTSSEINTQKSVLIPLSVKNPKSLPKLANELVQQTLSTERNQHAGNDYDLLEQLSIALHNHRSHYKYRECLVVNSVKSLLDQLLTLSQKDPKIIKASKSDKKIAFVFSGQGPQWKGMGSQLMKENTTYRSSVEECDREFKNLSGWSLLEKWDSLTDDQLHDPQYAQPALFFLHVGLLKMITEYGISPNAIVGHSMGEVSSFYASGCITLQQAIRVVYIRSHLQQQTSGLGNMLAVGLSKSQVEETILSKYPNHSIEIASINSPNSVALASTRSTLEAIGKDLDQAQVFNRILRGSCGFHSSLQDSIKDQVLDQLDHNMHYQQPHTTLYSTVYGTKVENVETSLQNYWWNNIRQSVQFQSSIEQMIQDGIDCFVEIGPHPVLISSIIESHSNLNNGSELTCLQTLKRNVDESSMFLSMISQLYNYGINVKYQSELKWNVLSSLNLPLYPWNRSSSVELTISNYDTSSSLPLSGKKDLTSPLSIYKSDLSCDRFPFLLSHIVQGSVIVPGAGFIIMCIQSVLEEYQVDDKTCASVQVDNAKFINSLYLEREETSKVTKVQLLLSSDAKIEQKQSVQIQSKSEKTWELNSTMEVTLKPNKKLSLERFDIESVNNRCQTILTKSEVYNKLMIAGIELGSDFKCIENVRVGNGELICQIGQYPTGNSALGIDVVFLDSVVQSFFCIVEYDNYFFLPVGVESLVINNLNGIINSKHNNLFVHCKVRNGGTRSLIKGDLTILDQEGNIHGIVKGLTANGFPQYAQQPLAQCFSINMIPQQVESSTSENNTESTPTTIIDSTNQTNDSNNRVIIFNNVKNFNYGQELAIHFKNVFLVNSYEKIDYVEGDKIICLQGLGQDDETFTSCKHILQIVKDTMESSSVSQPIPLWILTKGATNQTSNIVYSNASLTGLGRTIRSEAIKSVSTFNLDISSEFLETHFSSCIERISTIVKSNSELLEPEFTLSESGIYLPRLIENKELEIDSDSKPVTSSSQPILSLQLKSKNPGSVSDVIFKPSHLPSTLEDDQVEIIPHAVGLNFKDVMFAIGTLPESAFRKGNRNMPPFGVDCAGVISRVGKNVTEFKIGDEVIAIARASLASRVITHRYLVVHKPTKLTMMEASTIPIVFVTAYMALVHLSQIEEGETCLIHSATGGVGLAAIMIAQNVCKAHVLATVGSQEKKEYLREKYGIETIMNSRSLDFAEETLEATHGRGVDMVLNTLDGEAIDKNFSLLAKCGRFVEIGVKDIYNNKKIGLLPFHQNVSYHALDIDRLLDDKPQLLNKVMKQVVKLMNDEKLSPLPIKVFSSENIGEGLTYLSQSNQIGKVVIDMSDVISKANQLDNSSAMIAQEGTILVTGGLSGVGLALAQWLVTDQRVKNLVLVGRSKPSDNTQNILKELSKQATIRIELVDLSNLEKVKELFEKISSLPPLHTIFHLAATYDNVPIGEMTSELFQQVMNSKAVSAHNIHLATLNNSTLKQFFMFSSISAMLGNQEQSAYASANTTLDALALYRNKMGLPAVSVGFAPISSAGLVSSNATIKHILRYRGLLSLPLNSLFQSIVKLHSHSGHFILAGIDWEKLSLTYPHLKHFLNQHFVASRIQIKEEFSYRDLIVAQVSKSVGVQPNEVLESFERPLKEFGLDSITSIQLKNWVDSTFGPRIVTQLELLQGMTPKKLEERLSKVKPTTTTNSSINKILTKRKPTVQKSTPHNNSTTTQSTTSSTTTTASNGSNTSNNSASAYLNSKNPFIFGIGTANPPPFLQTEIAQAVEKEYAILFPNQEAKIQELYDNTSIHTRHLCYDVTQNSIIDLHNNGTYNSIYKQVAPQLAFESSSKAIAQWGGDVKDITHVVSCSCTGVCVPDINYLLIEKLGLSQEVQRVSVNFMGCFGGLSTLRTAVALASMNTKNRVLMVCTELSSIHYDISMKQDIKIGTAIFADGSGAMIVGCEPRLGLESNPLYEVLKANTIAIPNTIDMMEWELGPKGWSLGLSPEIPSIIYREMPQFVETLLEYEGEKVSDIENVDFALHSGGKAILNAIEVSLELKRERTVSGWNILHDYGNMSSATVLFVFNDLMKRTKASTNTAESFKEHVIGMAFGPGLSVEGVLMRNVAIPKQ